MRRASTHDVTFVTGYYASPCQPVNAAILQSRYGTQAFRTAFSENGKWRWN
jgi:hypothetical protein